jgi:FkbM family methyltransferase
VQKRPDGAPRFMLTLPPRYARDPGLEVLARLESTRAGFEYPTRAFFDAHLQAGDTFIDVGAHLGLYSLAAATLHPGHIRTVAFEPHPLNVLTLIHQLALNQRQHDVEVVCAACGAAPAIEKLWPFSSMGNFLSASRPDGVADDNPPLTVPIVPLDMLLENRPEIATGGKVMIKVDVEGFEPEVVTGATKLLGSGQVAAIVLEKGESFAAPERWAAFDAMTRILRDHGFTLRWFPHTHLPCALIPWVPGNETGNVIALGPGFEPRDVYDGPFVPYTPLPPPMTPEFSDAALADLTRRLIAHGATDGWRWANPRSMDPGSAERAALAGPHLPTAGSLLDLGAGLMLVLPKLKLGVRYTPVDLIRYSKATVLLDLNAGRFPDGKWDCVLMLELLEHMHDVPALLRRARAAAGRLVGTYKAIEETGDEDIRRLRGYFNDFDRATLRALLEAAGWRIDHLTVDGDHTLFVCS